MTITIHAEMMQRSPEWYAARCGILTASNMDKIVTAAKLQPARNATMRGHLMDLVAQRITNYVEEQYVSFDMMRGEADEIEARDIYSRQYAPVDQVGLVTNDKWGFVLGYSPDGLVGDDGLIEVKSRCQKYQIETIINGSMPDEYMLQVQTGLLVTERKWCDFISYCGGLPMVTIRVMPDPIVHEAIIAAADAFYAAMVEQLQAFNARVEDGSLRLAETQRRMENTGQMKGSED